MSGAPPLRQNGGDSAAETEARRQGTDDVRSALSGLLGLLARGRLVQGIALASGTNEIPHGLDHTPVSLWVCAPQGTATVYESPNTRTRRTVALVASAAVTVDLVVF